MSYLICFSDRDIALVMDALNFYSRQPIFGNRAEWAALMVDELENFKVQQDSEASY